MDKVYVVKELGEEVYGSLKGDETILTIFDSEDKAVNFIREIIKEDHERINSGACSYCTIEDYLSRKYSDIRAGRYVYSNTNPVCDTRIYYVYEPYVVE
jgi:hypothetical protein